MIAGLSMAVGCALAGSVGVLLKQRGAVAAPAVLARHPVRSAINLFGSKWWTVGWLVALGAWLLHGHASAASLIAVESTVIAISGVFICASVRLERLHLREGIFLATAAGALFGTSDIAIKHLVHPALNDLMLLVNPWTLSALIAMVVAFYASARSLQLGPAIAVITFTSLTGNIVALLGGILVFNDPIGRTPPQISARIGAFCLVILGAALLPGRHRAGALTSAGTRPPIPDRAIAIPQRAAS